jgi:surface antigen
MKKLLILPLVATLVGCQSMGQRETLGTFGGAALGGLVGAQIGGGSGRAIATAVGIMGGAMLGRGIGQQLDSVDAQRHSRTFYTALENNRTGTISRWQNHSRRSSGYTVPVKSFESSDGKYCREYQSVVTVAGRSQNAYGTACRQLDGSWQIQQ